MRWLVVALASGCTFSHGAAPRDDAGSNAGSADAPVATDATDADLRTLRAKTITVTATVTGTHANFPMWISLTDAEIGNRARADGTDIYFTDTAGAPIPFERQSWTKSTGRLDAWVRVGSLATGAQIQVRYGDLAMASQANAPGVFADYAAVWHFEDSLAAATIADARGQVPGTAQNLTATDQVAGQLGGAINFSGGNDSITFTNPITGTGSHTISLWINQRATTNNDAMVVLGNGSTNQARWFHSRYNTATLAVGFYANDWTNANEDIQGGGWTLLHWTFDGGGRVSRIYRDGALVAGPFTHGSGIDTQGTAGVIGNADSAFGTNMGILATLDEVRIIGVARNAGWIAAEALDQKTPSAFYTVGSEFTP